MQGRKKSSLSNRSEKSLKKCASEQQLGLCSSAAERKAVLGRLHQVAANAKLHRTQTQKHSRATLHMSTQLCIGNRQDSFLNVFSFIQSTPSNLKSVFFSFHRAKSNYLSFIVNPVTLLLELSHCYLLMQRLKDAPYR